MARKQRLDPELVDFLTLRVTLSRSLGTFTLKNLRDNWELPKTTLYRYVESKYREYSRNYAQLANLIRRNEEDLNRGFCHKCLIPHAGHERCGDCGVLLHEQIGFCDSCIGTRRRKILRALETVDVTDIFA